MVRSDSHAAAVAHGRMLASFVAPCAGACGPGMRPLAGALAGVQSLAGALAGGPSTSWSLAGVEMGLQPRL